MTIATTAKVKISMMLMILWCVMMQSKNQTCFGDRHRPGGRCLSPCGMQRLILCGKPRSRNSSGLALIFSFIRDITRLAKDPPIEKGSDSAPRRYKVVRSFAFRPDTYNGYEHRRTIGGATGFSANEDLRKGEGVCRTWEFTLRDPTNS